MILAGHGDEQAIAKMGCQMREQTAGKPLTRFVQNLIFLTWSSPV